MEPEDLEWIVEKFVEMEERVAMREGRSPERAAVIRGWLGRAPPGIKAALEALRAK